MTRNLEAAGGGALVLVALLACKGSDQPAGSGEPVAVAAPKPSAPGHASGAPSATHRDKADLSALPFALHAFRLNPDKAAAGVDKTGTKTITWRLPESADGTRVELVRYRDNPDAWRFGINGKRCSDVGELGLEVIQISESRGMAPHFSAWYRVKGGPLDGTFARVFNDGVPSPQTCTFLPGTRAYWESQGQPPPL